MNLKIMFIVANLIFSVKTFADCTSFQAECSKYKDFIVKLSKPAIALEVGKQLSEAVGGCMKGYFLAGLQSIWSAGFNI